MIFRCILFSVCVAGLAFGNNLPLEAEEMTAIQDRLTNYEMIEEILRLALLPEEKREEEKCLPEGAECKFNSGLSCCGISTRCNIWDTQLPAKKRGGAATWISKCRKYNAGVAMEKIGEFFQNLG